MPGSDPTDPRYSLANERTFLAYERTAVGLLVAAVGALNLLRDSWAETLLGVALLVAAALTAALGMRRYREADAAIREGRALPPSTAVPVVFTTVVVLVLLVGLSVVV
ncbi:DUF202 domain-containing protein [Nocardioides sp. J2M5]|uniref:DUF202 domain-containing protein n=1 Tax=Nocardioides palaemonis TaxID=2829810 RepID=UPI001BA738BF|nr:DUF202 domain-containing protein [Nocardioides palaemonis]MBS2936764.1 DUF202 domain-containing protein [Nocardioides palaemonis]